LTSDKKLVSNKELLGTILSIVLAIVLLFVAFRGIEFHDFSEALKKSSIGWILVFACTTMTAHILRAYRWKVMLRRVKPNLSLHHAFAAIMLGYGINNAVPRLGEVSRAIFLGRYERISRMSILGTIVVERMIDMIVFGLAVLVSGIIYSGEIYTKFPWLRATSIIGLVLMLIMVVMMVLFVRHRDALLPVITKQIARASASAAVKTESLLIKLTDGFLSIQGTRTYVEVVIFSVLIMLNYAFNSFIGFYIVGIQYMIPVTFAMAWVTMSISSVGMIIPTPGGIGSYHAITQMILVTLFGVGKVISTAYAVISHGISYFLSIAFAVLYFFLFRKRYGTNPDDTIFNEREQEKSI
jgi:glycosyltransferase 2 family protein